MYCAIYAKSSKCAFKPRAAQLRQGGMWSLIESPEFLAPLGGRPLTRRLPAPGAPFLDPVPQTMFSVGVRLACRQFARSVGPGAAGGVLDPVSEVLLGALRREIPRCPAR